MTDTDLYGDGGEADPHVCPECAERFDGPMWQMRRGRHRRDAHGIVGQSKASARDRARRGTGDADEKPPAPPGEKPPKATAEKKPAPPRKREPLDQLGEYIFAGLSFVSAKAGKMAASRMFRLNSAAFGPALEKSVQKGSGLDKVLQPFARLTNQSPEMFALAAGPITAEAFLANPNPVTQAAFVSAVAGSVPAVIRAGKTKMREQQKLEADLAAFAEAFGKGPGENVSLAEYANYILFGNVTGPAAPPPQGEPAAWDAEMVG